MRLPPPAASAAGGDAAGGRRPGRGPDFRYTARPPVDGREQADVATRARRHRQSQFGRGKSETTGFFWGNFIDKRIGSSREWFRLIKKQVGFRARTGGPQVIAADVAYVRHCLAQGWIEGPCLELGAAIAEHSCHALLEGAGLEAVRTDMTPGPGLAFSVDFEADARVVQAASSGRRFRTVLILNVLEHTFDPVRVLDNALALVAPGGALVVITPTVWSLHSYPIDCWRLNPDFYVTYCSRRGLELVEDSLEFVGLGPVKRTRDGHFELPPQGASPAHRRWSRLIHKIFNTAGRGQLFPSHVACGAVLRKPISEC